MTVVAIKWTDPHSDDVKEILRGNPDAKNITECAYGSDKLWLGLVEGQLACLWGLVPATFLSENAYLWLVTTPVVEKHKFIFVRWSQRYIEKMLEIYPVICGHCLVDNDPAIRWIKWLGGVFKAPEGDYVPFTIRKK